MRTRIRNGETRLVASNDTEAGRARNRRVEIFLEDAKWCGCLRIRGMGLLPWV